MELSARLAQWKARLGFGIPTEHGYVYCEPCLKRFAETEVSQIKAHLSSKGHAKSLRLG